RPMRLVFTNLWAFSGPFQRLPIRHTSHAWVSQRV
ncbi:uncharacterized protein METZ01_LOCUS135367, partial [marine metagenome]